MRILISLLSQNKHNAVDLSILKMRRAFIFGLWLYFIAISTAKEIIVGENAGGWSVGVKFEPLNAVVGDQLVRISSSPVALGFMLYGVQT